MGNDMNAKDVDDGKRYRVRMTRTREVADTKLRRNTTPILKGRIVKELADDVADVQPIAD